MIPLLMTPAKQTLVATASILLIASPAFAGPVIAPAPEEKELSIYDKIWAVPVLYKNPENPYIEELRFTGRFQLDAFTQDSNFGHEDDWVIRRTRFGVFAKVLKDFTLAVEVDFNPQVPDPLYTRLTEAYVAWEPNKAFKLSVGKLSAKFTMDGATSSNNLITLERNNLSNNLWFPNEYFSGVAISGTHENWVWNTGIYSAGRTNPEFGDFNGGNFWLGSVGYSFAKALGVDKALLRADYVYNQPDLSNDGTRFLENIESLTFELQAGKWGVGTNVAAGQGFGGQSDLWGFVVMPSYNITKELQAVVRYTYLSSADPGGIRFNRYENYATSGRGDEYNEFYVGLNYYFYGQKLKLQTGVDYADMNAASGSSGNYHGWTWTTGFRVSF